jgi:lipoprotein NlpD
MMARMRPATVVAAAAILSLFVASCASSRVVRGPSSHRSHPVKVSTPRYGATAVVQRGDTIYHIATSNGITALDLALWNGIPPPYIIYPGQRLRLYPGATSTAGTTSPPRSSTAPATSRAPSTPTPPPVASTPANAPFAWRWPTDGSLVETYASGDPTRQGIDIAGSAGQPVRAAADGVVVYSGSGLVGYGELIIVKHNDQWLSAYGHNRARLVNEGQLVKAGQQIAEMGRSGAARDMLHFEIRYNGKPVDPQAYLPKR